MCMHDSEQTRIHVTFFDLTAICVPLIIHVQPPTGGRSQPLFMGKRKKRRLKICLRGACLCSCVCRIKATPTWAKSCTDFIKKSLCVHSSVHVQLQWMSEWEHTAAAHSFLNSFLWLTPTSILLCHLTFISSQDFRACIASSLLSPGSPTSLNVKWFKGN